MRLRVSLRLLAACLLLPRRMLTAFTASSLSIARVAGFMSRPGISGWMARTLIGVALTSACSPAYNWRTVTDAAQGYTIDLPAKPTIDERPVEIAGAALTMRVRAAQAQDAEFAIAVVELPRDDARLGQAVADALRGALARNLRAEADAHAVQVPVSTGGAASGSEIIATGAAGEASERRTIHARIVARGRHVYQAAIIGPRAPPQDQIDQFFGSFKLL